MCCGAGVDHNEESPNLAASTYCPYCYRFLTEVE